MKELRIDRPQLTRSPRDATCLRWSVQASYPGLLSRPETLWFDIPEDLADGMDSGGNAWLVTLLPLAVTLGCPLSMDLPVDETLVENLGRLMEIWSGWYDTLQPVPLNVPVNAPTEPPGPRRSALFFSGGIDSHYTLFRAAEIRDADIDDLLFLQGFDIPLENTIALGRARGRIEDVADCLGKRVVSVATNLRQTRFQEAGWTDIAFGCLLAGAGLSLGGRYRQLVISSGLPATQLRPHASHPDTDPLFSSSWTRFIHYHVEDDRIPKLEFLRAYPLALKNLRVCYESDTGGNCGRCLKCVIAMSMLEIVGGLEQATSFPGPSLDLDLIRRTYISQGVISFRTIQASALEHGRKDIAEAVQAAFDRTERLDRWFQLKWIRAVRSRFEAHPLARRATRWIRPSLWRIGRWLNRRLP